MQKMVVWLWSGLTSLNSKDALWYVRFIFLIDGFYSFNTIINIHDTVAKCAAQSIVLLAYWAVKGVLAYWLPVVFIKIVPGVEFPLLRDNFFLDVWDLLDSNQLTEFVNWNSYVLDLVPCALVVLNIVISTNWLASTSRRAPIEKCCFPLLFWSILLVIYELLVKRIKSLFEQSFLNLILELIPAIFVEMRQIIRCIIILRV